MLTGWVALAIAQAAQEPTGTVNPVCWKLLAIAGTGFGILGSVIVVLAKKLWDTVLARIEDQKLIGTAIEKRKEG